MTSSTTDVGTIEQLKADYAQAEAAGAGDDEVGLIPSGSSSAFVDSYEAHIPEVPQSFSIAVRTAARAVTASQVDELTADLRAPLPEQQANAAAKSDALKRRMQSMIEERKEKLPN